jgi:Fungal specific transcription factor domain
MEDMALWHHFIKSTAATLSNPWKEDLPQLALKCDYLMHGILATGALHLGYLSSDPKEKERYDYLASQHQDLALGPFQQAMLNLGAENASQLFAFSTLLMAFNFASYRSREYLLPFSDSAGEYQGLSNWMVCLRGCTSIVYAAMKQVEAGPLGFLVTGGGQLQNALADGAVPDPEVDQSLSLLTETALSLPIIKSTTTVEEMEAYIDAIKRLRALLASSSQRLELALQRAAAAIWVGTVSETFIRLLSEKRAPALVIMAHYCLLLKKCEDCWYMERRSFNLFEACQQSLSEEWAPYIQYPLSVIYSRS